MDEEDKQFLDLLSDTSLSFFKHFNNFSKSMTRGQNNNFNKMLKIKKLVHIVKKWTKKVILKRKSNNSHILLII